MTAPVHDPPKTSAVLNALMAMGMAALRATSALLSDDNLFRGIGAVRVQGWQRDRPRLLGMRLQEQG
jgi:hypothetical protein